jgi:hypothetical protein
LSASSLYGTSASTSFNYYNIYYIEDSDILVNICLRGPKNGLKPGRAPADQEDGSSKVIADFAADFLYIPQVNGFYPF